MAWWPSRAYAARVAATLLVSTAGGFAAHLAGMPAAWIAGGLLAVASASLAGFNSTFPRAWNAPVFLVLGIYSGTGVTPEVLEQMRTWPASFAILGLSLAAIVIGSYWWLHKRHGWSRNDALLSSLPGGLAFVISAAEGLKADLKKIAIAQCIRLVLLIETIPLVALLVGHPTQVLSRASYPDAGLVDLLIMLGAGIVVSLLLEKLRLPGGWVVGGMLASATLLLTGTVEAGLPASVVIPVSICIGALTGSRFRPGDIYIIPRIAGPTLGALAIAATISTLGASAVSLLFGVNIIQTLLAFAPGALEALTVVAFQLNIDPAYVAAHHVARFIGIAIAVPIIARWLAGRP